MSSYLSEAWAEQITVPNIDEDSVSQYVPTYKTFYVLALKWGLKNRRFKQNVIGKDKADKILIAGNVHRGWSVDVGNANGLQAQLSWQALADYATGCPGIDHPNGHDWRRNRDTCCA